MIQHQRNIVKFMMTAHEKTGSGLQFVPSSPIIPSEEIRHLRAKLIAEEAIETITALGFTLTAASHGTVELRPHGKGCNIVEVADGCADLSVVNIGTLCSFGINAGPIIHAVDMANLQKFTGDAHAREDGKWIKPSDWKAPDLMKLLKEQGYNPT